MDKNKRFVQCNHVTSIPDQFKCWFIETFTKLYWLMVSKRHMSWGELSSEGVIKTSHFTFIHLQAGRRNGVVGKRFKYMHVSPIYCSMSPSNHGITAKVSWLELNIRYFRITMASTVTAVSLQTPIVSRKSRKCISGFIYQVLARLPNPVKTKLRIAETSLSLGNQ